MLPAGRHCDVSLSLLSARLRIHSECLLEIIVDVKCFYCRSYVRSVFDTAELCAVGSCYCRSYVWSVFDTAELRAVCNCYCRSYVWSVFDTAEVTYGLYLILQKLGLVCI